MQRANTIRGSSYFFIVLGIIALLGTAVLWVFHRYRPSVDGQLFYIAKQDGYYGLYERDGRSEKKIFDSGDILEAYPNLARYHISYDVSADGRYIAYSAVNVLGDADIFVHDRENGEHRNLTSDAHTDTYPVFSHDSAYIAYLSHEKSGRRYDEIFLIKRDGSERIRLTNLFLRMSSLSFSPDDQSILFVKHLGDRSSITTVDIESRELNELTRPLCLNISPSFDSKGERIVYISDCHDNLDVWIMNSDGTDRKPLFKGTGGEHEPLFLRDDESVVFISVSEENGNGGPNHFSLLSVDLDGREVSNLLPGKFQNGQINLSHLDIPAPKNHIYFRGKVLDNKRRAHHEVFTLDIEKRLIRRIRSRGIDILDPVVR